MQRMKKILFLGGAATAMAIGYGFLQSAWTPSQASDSATVMSNRDVGAIPRVAGFKTTTIVSGLQNPWGMAWLPNGDILVTERPGRLRLVRDGRLIEAPLEGTPPVFARGQGGLLDVTLHPDFAKNRWIYLSHSAEENGQNFTVLTRAKLSADATRLEEAERLFEVTQRKNSGVHFGSRIVWLPDGTMLLSTGDGGNFRDAAQRRDSHLGKILRLDENGKPAKGNPFSAAEGTKPEVWSYGHRNIQGLFYDASTKRVWATEHGPQGGDELNLVQAGQNAGWPIATYGREYGSGIPIGEGTQHSPRFLPPRLVWIPSTGASGLTVYRGDKFPQWQGNIFSGGLATRDIRRVIVDANGLVTREENMRIGKRIRDVRTGPDGFLYYLTDEGNGEIGRIEPA